MRIAWIILVLALNIVAFIPTPVSRHRSRLGASEVADDFDLDFLDEANKRPNKRTASSVDDTAERRKTKQEAIRDVLNQRKPHQRQDCVSPG